MREDGGLGEVYIAFGNLEAITPRLHHPLAARSIQGQELAGASPAPGCR
jgi:hypothetical protein